MTFAKYLLILGFTCLLNGYASDKDVVETSGPAAYSLAEISGRATGMSGMPMPQGWNAEPEPPVARDLGYFADLELFSRRDLLQTTLTLFSKQWETLTNVTVEVRDAEGNFLKKFLVQVEPQDLVVLTFRDWMGRGGVRFSLFSSQDFGATMLNGIESQDLLVGHPKMEIKPNEQPGVAEKYRKCAVAFAEVTITNDDDTPVTAWAYAWAYPNGADQYLQHLKVYYPNSWTVFHHPLKTGWGPWCAFTIGVVKTNTSPGATSGHHSWSDPLAVLEGNSTGTVDCLNPMICGYNSWTWEKP